MTSPYNKALAEIGHAMGGIDGGEYTAAIEALASAHNIALYGVGREGLQIKGLAMRLFHLGLSASVVGDMTTPALCRSDLLVVSAGPGSFSTVEALMNVAREAGANVLLFTANPDAPAGRLATSRVLVPAQTMANDIHGDSVLPMGSLYEGALFVLFEMLVLSLKERLNVTAAQMRAVHTNLE
ncbi:SIS domain-containing protein [Aureimonas fodinaquatilis]|uniref:SIS domain-containing protein n=1 Tax=Aureimonas fodinaquatilis TaxID=2565783 RepID=A0A5B0DYQ2_9HYPH|nr:SIS domain-containing protein [Aureimonas fodinaquatilis]KAA0971142.1 SIS domain-containing protein [Aureimonas fodinaquatilis]